MRAKANLAVLSWLAALGCASTLQQRAGALGAARVEVTWSDAKGLAGLDPEPLRRAVASGVAAASANHWLPFVIDDGARASIAITLGPPLAWRGSDSTMLIELPFEAVLRDAAGEAIAVRALPCYDEGVPSPGVLVPADHDPAPERLAARRLATPATWDDLPRAYAALAEWCGARLVEELSRDLK